MNLEIKPSKKRYYHAYDYRVIVKYCIPHISNDFPMKVITNRNINFYFNGLENIQKFKDHYKDKVLSIEGPVNEYHSELLGKTDVDIKKTLYYNKYRYKVKFGFLDNKISRENHTIITLRNLVNSNKEDFLGTHLHEGFMYSFTMPVVYTKDEQSLMMLRLSTDAKARQIIKAITIKEIKANGQANSKEVN